MDVTVTFYETVERTAVIAVPEDTANKGITDAAEKAARDMGSGALLSLNWTAGSRFGGRRF